MRTWQFGKQPASIGEHQSRLQTKETQLAPRASHDFLDVKNIDLLEPDRRFSAFKATARRLSATKVFLSFAKVSGHIKHVF